MPDDSAAPVLIAGGGIAGLAAALALAKRGVPSHVVERRTALDDEGAGIQLGPNAVKVLRSLGVAEDLEHHVAVPSGLQIYDGVDGRPIALAPLGRWIEKRHGAPYWATHRRDLYTVLADHARRTPAITLHDATSISLGDNASSVRFGDVPAPAHRALIGADGLWSTTRRLITTSTPTFTGKSAYRAVASASAVPPVFAAHFTTVWLAPRAHIVTYPIRTGSEVAVIVVLDDTAPTDAWAGAVPPGEVAAAITPFAAPLRALVAALPAWRKWSLHALAKPAPMARGTTALIGDAAHPVLPFLAQGAALALEDAVVLASALDGTTNIAKALAGVAHERRERVRKVARASRLNGRIYHLHGFAAHARNAALGMMPGERLITRLDWLYGWSPQK
jgi:salicylate hydroxylase